MVHPIYGGGSLSPNPLACTEIMRVGPVGRQRRFYAGVGELGFHRADNLYHTRVPADTLPMNARELLNCLYIYAGSTGACPTACGVDSTADCIPLVGNGHDKWRRLRQTTYLPYGAKWVDLGSDSGGIRCAIPDVR